MPVSDHFAKMNRPVKVLNKYADRSGAPGFRYQDTFAQTSYSNEYIQYMNKVNQDLAAMGAKKEVRDKVSAKLDAIYARAEQDYNQAVKDPTFKWSETQWAAEYKSITDDLTAIANHPAGNVDDPANEGELKTFAEKKIQELKKFETEKYEAEVKRTSDALENLRTSNASHYAALQEAKRLNFGVKDRQKHMFEETTGMVSAKELKDASTTATLSVMTEDELYEQLKKVRESQGRIYIGGKNTPYEGREFIYEKDTKSCKPRPPVKDENYKAEYGGSIELLRAKEPASDIVFYIPAFNDPHDKKPDTSFLTEKYIKNKITSVFEASRERGIPMKLDDKTRGHLIALRQKERDSRWNKIRGKKSGLEKEIDRLFDLEISMARKEERDRQIGKDKHEMIANVDRTSANLDRMSSTSTADYKAAFDAELKVPGCDKDAVFVRRLDEIEKDRKDLLEAGKLIDQHRRILQERIDGENKDDPNAKANRNPFLSEHIEKLEKLTAKQQEKLQALDEKAKVVREDAQFAVLPAVAARAEKCVQDIAPMLTKSDDLAKSIKDYKEKRQHEAAVVLEERKNAGLK